MNQEELIDLIKNNTLKKLTGPPEHWLTTFNTGFWGLTESWQNQWKLLSKNDLCLFHSTHTMYLNPKPKVKSGIIGVGLIEGTSIKTSYEWIGEIENSQNTWPYLVHFNQIWWFGDTDQVKNESIRDKISKGKFALNNEVMQLSKNAISFKEMKENDCLIPAQNSISNISQSKNESFLKLILPRLKHKTRPLQEPQIFPDEVLEPKLYKEGAVKSITVNSYERDKKARLACIQHYGAKCQVCGLDFSKKYGKIGSGFIHVHHLVPLSDVKGEYDLNPVEDLKPVCPNCHAMLHQKKPAFTIDELKTLMLSLKPAKSLGDQDVETMGKRQANATQQSVKLENHPKKTQNYHSGDIVVHNTFGVGVVRRRINNTYVIDFIDQGEQTVSNGPYLKKR